MRILLFLTYLLCLSFAIISVAFAKGGGGKVSGSIGGGRVPSNSGKVPSTGGSSHTGSNSVKVPSTGGSGHTGSNTGNNNGAVGGGSIPMVVPVGVGHTSKPSGSTISNLGVRKAESQIIPAAVVALVAYHLLC
ncbi:hypothetical protein K493DRAFT_321712 [Basidiobolus meristosporus CBS 931.73]|uniref:Uncharacterized protein n=1 Tax=Basidiobolus meristosporus CBS 931.73 TaxID=1314790 RepID=A0A1Y1WPS1_9FUNG|nr:hypothetical protein K493DRAFT_321712 [Basidiobolus meristosporus CBS 931.73]|eukprot:ORX75375.1 hypothetical protein K493DRAFT_321712 [Basidiobolus meristosporus CBS 931.73]